MSEIQAGTKRLNIEYRCRDLGGVISFEQMIQDLEVTHSQLELARRVVMIFEIAQAFSCNPEFQSTFTIKIENILKINIELSFFSNK